MKKYIILFAVVIVCGIVAKSAARLGDAPEVGTAAP